MPESAFPPTYDEIARAEQMLHEHITSSVSAESYLDELETTYQSFSEGRASLNRMLRVASFVRRDDDEKNYTPAVEAMYSGELLASNLLDYLGDEEASGGHHAHEFLQYRLRKSKPASQHPETRLELDARHSQIATRIQSDLEATDGSLSIIDIYDRLGERYLPLVAPSEKYRAIARSGFRLVLLEAMQSSPDRALEAELKTIILLSSPQASTTSVPLETIPQNIPIPYSLKQLDRELAIPTSPESFEEYTKMKTILLDSYKASFVRHCDEFPGATLDLSVIGELCETDLNRLVNNERLFEDGDVLRFHGTFYGRLSASEASGTDDEEEEEDEDEDENSAIVSRFFQLFHSNAEVRGEFDGMTVVKAPANKELIKREGQSEERGTYPTVRGIQSPAIRLKKPVIIRRDNEGHTYTEAGLFESIEIPLTYKNYTIERAQ